jgi:hypothetical protein
LARSQCARCRPIACKTINHRETKTGSLANFLGREKGFEGAVHDIRRHTGPGILHGDMHILAAGEINRVFAERDIARRDYDAPAFWHRIARVDHQIEKGGSQLCLVCAAAPEVIADFDEDLDGFAYRSTRQRHHRVEHAFNRECFRIKAPAPSETQQLLGKAGTVFGPMEGRFGKPAAGFVDTRTSYNEFKIPDDYREEIIKVVRDPAGQLANRFHLLRLVQLLLNFKPTLHFSVNPMLQLLVNAPQLGLGI